MGYSWVNRVRVGKIPGTCGCPRAAGRDCMVHSPRPDPEGSRAQRRAAKNAKRGRDGV
jgi:hypothetical protein